MKLSKEDAIELSRHLENLRGLQDFRFILDGTDANPDDMVDISISDEDCYDGRIRLRIGSRAMTRFMEAVCHMEYEIKDEVKQDFEIEID